jgi:hypothetical protein
VLHAQPKPKPHRLVKRAAKAKIETKDRKEREKCHDRSGGRCEVVVRCYTGLTFDGEAGYVDVRCHQRATENHHLIGGIGRRNVGRSILAAHRLDVCHQSHEEIGARVIVPITGCDHLSADTVRYVRTDRRR